MSITNSVFLYKGAGADSTCVNETERVLKKSLSEQYSIITVDASYFKSDKRPRTYVLPGGQATVMGKELKKVATIIKDHVERGSGLLGFCAGAMAGSKFSTYRLPAQGESICIDNLHYSLDLGPEASAPTFFNPKYKIDGYLENSDKVACLAELRLRTGEKFKCFWNRGSTFHVGYDDVILAEYIFSKETPRNSLINETKAAAVIRSDFELGPIVFSGVHPELAAWCKEKGYSLSDSDLQMNESLLELCFTEVGLKHIAADKIVLSG